MRLAKHTKEAKMPLPSSTQFAESKAKNANFYGSTGWENQMSLSLQQCILQQFLK